MPTNDFLPFSAAGGANVVNQATYAASSTLPVGFQSGILPSAALNKPLRQATLMAAVLAQFIANKSGANSVDDGTTATLLSNLEIAIAAVTSGLGIGQTLTNMHSSRSVNGTSYTNSTGQPIFIEVSLGVAAGEAFYFTKAGAITQIFGNNTPTTTNISFSSIVQNGQSYSVTATATPGFTWFETR